MLPTNRKTLPNSFTKGLFNPEYADRQVNLNDLVQEVVVPQRQEDAKQSVLNRIQTPSGLLPVSTSNGIPVPLTEAESLEADKQIAQTLRRIQATYQKLDMVRGAITTAINSELDGKELSFKVDISKKRRIERALKSLYGERLETITYSMYLDMLKAKVQMEKDEVADYAAGKVEEEEDEEESKKDRR